MTMQAPRFVVAGERSGTGKSTITVGMLLALRAMGAEPQPFKAGPDFLDPMHHSIVLGKPSRNLDTWMFGGAVAECFARGSRGSDVSVIEGVMGLYDGFDGRSEIGSTAHLSKVLKAPVVLVLDASRTARSAGAVALGFQEYDRDVDIAGVIFNNVGSQRHLSMLQDSLRGVECLGGVPRTESAHLESRHLGLVPAAEGFDPARYDAIRAMVQDNVDMARLLEIARSAPELEEPAPGAASESTCRVGVAMDEAFNFYYQENLDALSRLGAEVVPFSPIRDELPDVDGLYFGGGYPELFAKELEANASMRSKVRERSGDGMPVYAECGGMMYACRSVTDLESRSCSMCGLFDAEVTMTPKLQALGYVDAAVERDNVLAPAGSATRGHEFHYSRVEAAGDEGMAYSLRKGKGIRDGKDGMVAHSTLASYLHLHFASCPKFAEAFVGACAAHGRR